MGEWAVTLRPQTLDDLVGQEANKAILSRWIKTNTLPNAVILYGRSGAGKTTTARILAKALDADYMEIPAASHNGIDDARQINEMASRLSLYGNHKVFCIDEAQGLSKAAWDALLKSIEEPNQYTHFIFCTTEYNKLPPAIKGRSRMLKFYSLSKADLMKLAKDTLAANNASLPDDVIDLVISRSDGQARDLLKLLQSTVEAGIQSREVLSKFLAIPDRAGMGSFIKSVALNKPKMALKVIDDIDVDYVEWARECVEFIQFLVKDKFGIQPLTGSEATIAKLREIAAEVSDIALGNITFALLKIRENSTAYAALYALALAGV